MFSFTISACYWFPRPSSLARKAPGVESAEIFLPIKIPGDYLGRGDDDDGDDGFTVFTVCIMWLMMAQRPSGECVSNSEDCCQWPKQEVHSLTRFCLHAFAGATFPVTGVEQKMWPRENFQPFKAPTPRNFYVEAGPPRDALCMHGASLSWQKTVLTQHLWSRNTCL